MIHKSRIVPGHHSSSFIMRGHPSYTRTHSHTHIHSCVYIIYDIYTHIYMYIYIIIISILYILYIYNACIRQYTLPLRDVRETYYTLNAHRATKHKTFISKINLLELTPNPMRPRRRQHWLQYTARAVRTLESEPITGICTGVRWVFVQFVSEWIRYTRVL